MIEIKQEKYNQIIEDILPLLPHHWREVAHYQDKIPLQPKFDVYDRLEHEGKIIIFGMREGENGKLIGYSIYAISQHLHYSSCLVASNDLLFLIPEKRNSSLGKKLIKECGRLLEEMGINRILYHVKPEHDFSPLLLKMGYMKEEIMYGKFISKEEKERERGD